MGLQLSSDMGKKNKGRDKEMGECLLRKVGDWPDVVNN